MSITFGIYCITLAGARGFKPPTFCTPCKRASKLRDLITMLKGGYEIAENRKNIP